MFAILLIGPLCIPVDMRMETQMAKSAVLVLYRD